MAKKRNKAFDTDYAPYGTTTVRGSPDNWRASYSERMMGHDEAVSVLDKDNPYTVLDLSQGADKDAVKKAYRLYSLKWHPDVNKSPEAEEMFKKGHAAYSLLMNQ